MFPPAISRGSSLARQTLCSEVRIRRKYWFRALPGARDTVSIQDYPGPASSGLGYRNLKRKMVRLLSTEVSTPKPAWQFHVAGSRKKAASGTTAPGVAALQSPRIEISPACARPSSLQIVGKDAKRREGQVRPRGGIEPNKREGCDVSNPRQYCR